MNVKRIVKDNVQSVKNIVVSRVLFKIIVAAVFGTVIIIKIFLNIVFGMDNGNALMTSSLLILSVYIAYKYKIDKKPNPKEAKAACKNCAALINKSDEACFNCGQKVRKNELTDFIILTIVIFAILFIFFKGFVFRA
ncbi:MAG: hypothetical protein LBF71_01515 [Campylobacteraceae bacterium]|jgi:nitrate reductase NapE component|nr:hypothetical protein [Campylobacteraceae bacterium]